MSIAVEIVDVSKRFTLHTEPSRTIKERFLFSRRNTTEPFYALQDITLAIPAGQTVGLLGHNGSGKSTLLKCIAGTIRPSTGRIRVRGRMAAMLELGAGFHPDLTGRENVYLNGSILGFSKEHIGRIFDDIVAFSELEHFIDSQVKHYSSGMYARLGFAVAVNLEPDVLLVDEVLSVGDEAFQRKCLERVRRLQGEGRTIVLVTHSPDQVRLLCDQAAVLDHGEMIHWGETAEAARIFRKSLDPDFELDDDEEGSATSSKPLRIASAHVELPPGRTAAEPGDTVRFHLGYQADRPIEHVRARMILTTHDGVQMMSVATSDLWGHDLERVEGTGEVVFTITDLPVLDAHYLVGFVLQDHQETMEYDRLHSATSFDVFTGRPLIGRVDFRVSAEHLQASAVEAVDR